MPKHKLSAALDNLFRFLAGQPFFVRSIYAETLLEDFFVSAVASLLAIRLYLAATGFPQLSFGTLHIAHILWGGLFMLVSLVMLLAFLNRRSQTIAAVVGGVGFGAFIDELGKFVTSDNDYFFRPAVAIIYVVFIMVFIVTRAISRRRSFSPQHALANAFDIAMQAGLSGLDREHRDTAMELLADCPPGPVRQHLEAILRSMRIAPRVHFRPVRHVLDLLDAFYERAAQTWWFTSIVVGFFAITAVTGISAVLVVGEWSWGLALWLGAGLVILVALAWSKRVNMRYVNTIVAVGILASIFTGWAVLVNQKAMPLSMVDIAQFVFPGVSGVIIVAGVAMLPRSRLNAYLMFRLAVFVSIFLTQVLSFYEEQFLALLGLAPNILILAGLRYMIDHEREKTRAIAFV